MNNLYQTSSTIPVIQEHVPGCSSKVNILWTGGLDSTFRMLELSKLNIIVQPYYIRDKRPSEKNELNAISLILDDIMVHPETRCKILPLQIIDTKNIQPDKEISRAYQKLHEATSLGIQFDWLARFANQVPGVELGMEKSEMSKGYKCVKNYGKIIPVNNKNPSYYIIDKQHSNEELVKVFGNFHLPYLLFHTSKLEETETYKKWGYEATLKKTWFCHTPINNQPCGICHPCKSTIEEGLSFRMPPAAIRRYNYSVRYQKDSIYGMIFRLHVKIEMLEHYRFNFSRFSPASKALLHQA